MNQAASIRMAGYNRWMNHRIYEAAARLSSAELMRDRGAFFGSLFHTLNHIAVSDTLWLHRFAQMPGAATLRAEMKAYILPTSLRQELATSLPALQVYRVALDQIITDWADSLTESELVQTLAYVNTTGQPQRKRLGALVQHFFNHQTHHRGQASTLLFQAGVDVGMTDLLAVIANEV
jgi:uncharacterized damage-inducible protein DinB